MDMKIYVVAMLVFLSVNMGFAQETMPMTGKKGKLYVYWGWNVSWYTDSDITFSGKDYNFTLKDVWAKDRQTKFAIDPFLNPAKATIPQYNFRLGYFFKDNWNISFGIDHMKYVMQQNQTVQIDGVIDGTGTEYDDTYMDEDIFITEDFLQFEHTDGLNFANIDIRHVRNLFDWNKVDIHMTEGLGAGILIPRTNTTLVGKERYDQFHLSGYGISAMVGLNVTFFDKFFIQSELKGGFINMPDVRTTNDKADKASHHFFFGQTNILFGGYINLFGPKKNQ